MKSAICRAVVLGVILLAMGGAVAQETGAPASARTGALARMPVKEVTVFKDGHALVVHEGSLPTRQGGEVVMDYLPTPVLGTFWPYCSAPDAKLTAVRAGRQRVVLERTALSLRELLEANVGSDVIINENGKAQYEATIVGVPTRSSEELLATDPPNSPERLPVKGDTILLRTEGGVKVVAISRIQDVTFKDEFKSTVANEELRNLLTLELDWTGRRPKRSAPVGMMYLQRGIRWIPNYKITIDGEGNARVKLQATLINELTDLQDVTANLVVGVPTFAFEDTLDPIALQKAAAQLSEYFRTDSRTAFALSNAIMSQRSDMRVPGRQPTGGPVMDLGPDVSARAAGSEDLFVFTIEHVSLRKGERVVLPVAEYTLKYRDVFVLDVPFFLPPELRQHVGRGREAEMAALFHAPKVIHVLRLSNKSDYPLTTAPALILRGKRVLAQGMMTYTARGGTSDLTVTTAVDVQVNKIDREVKQTPNAARYDGHQFARVDLAGTIHLVNHKSKAIDLEIVRNVLGNADEADAGGVIEKVNVMEDPSVVSAGVSGNWWWWSSMPRWWPHFNGVGRITWKLKLEPGKSVDLHYAWHYYWRYVLHPLF